MNTKNSGYAHPLLHASLNIFLAMFFLFTARGLSKELVVTEITLTPRVITSWSTDGSFSRIVRGVM